MNLLQYCFCFIFLFLVHYACRISASQPRIKSMLLTLEGKIFHWTTREVLKTLFLSFFFFLLFLFFVLFEDYDREYRGAVYNFNMDFHPERSRRKFEGKLSLYNESFYSCYILLVFYFLWHGSRYFKKEHVYNRQNYARELWKHKNLSHKAHCTEKKNTILCGWHVLFSPPTHFWAY